MTIWALRCLASFALGFGLTIALCALLEVALAYV